MEKTIIGAGLGFGGDLALGAINNQYAKQSSAEQYRRQLEFWEMQNKYNSPIAQRQRLEDAGLNPNMMYSDGGMQNTADTAPQVPGNEYSQKGLIRLNMMEKMMQLGMMSADIELKKAQAGNISTDTQLKSISVRFENEVYELRKLGLINDNELKESQRFLNYTNANDLEQTRQVRIDAMISQIAELESRAYKNRKNGKLSEIKYKEVQFIIRKMRTELRMLQRKDRFEFNNGDEPFEFLNRRGIFGSGIDFRGLYNKLGAPFNIMWNRSNSFRGYSNF